TGQIGTFYSILGIITAIVLGAVSVRFNHKSLLLTGFLTFLASAIGCGFAPSFLLMIIFYSLSGLSVSIIAPMTTTLVANYFPPDFRPNAIGWLIAG
ncbi:MAG: MFS transporter, partial [Aliifodinibius sp.]|nr:MFS transporter [Fodinibius sp.]NIV16548.1 MFS transporter [Fodinibius sp.]NIY30516.1 MFS transporter [Fodinibius sp.]